MEKPDRLRLLDDALDRVDAMSCGFTEVRWCLRRVPRKRTPPGDESRAAGGEEIDRGGEVWNGRAAATSMESARTQLTVTPCGPSSRARARTSPSSPLLAALYAARSPWPSWVKTEDTATMRPCPSLVNRNWSGQAWAGIQGRLSASRVSDAKKLMPCLAAVAR